MAAEKIAVKKISPAELSRYEDFITRAGHKSYAHFAEIPAKALNNLFFQELESCKDSDLAVFMAMSRGRPLGLLSLHRLDWDSNHFGMPMAKIRHLLGGADAKLDFAAQKSLLKAAVQTARKMKFRHLAVRLSADDFNAVRALELAGFYLADTIVEYYFDFRRQKLPPKPRSQCTLRLFRPADLKLVQNSVQSIFAGYLDRFHRDPHLPSARSDQLYLKWLVNSCKGMADEVLLAFVGSRLAGITTLEIHHQLNKILPFTLGEVALTGVVPAFRGQGIYTAMLAFAQNYFSNKVELFRYATQLNNYHVQKVLTGLGFSLKYAFHTYHYFFQEARK